MGKLDQHIIFFFERVVDCAVTMDELTMAAEWIAKVCRDSSDYEAHDYFKELCLNQYEKIQELLEEEEIYWISLTNEGMAKA